MRFGLVGTGPWARMATGPGLAAAGEVDLVGVWGRSPAAAGELAAQLGCAAYASLERLLGDVEAVAFAVPPAVQAQLALAAVRAGRHVLLDKPVALDAGQAAELRDTAAGAGVASVVFFTDRFLPDSRAWFAEVTSGGRWRGGWMRWFGALAEGNPFADSPWRHELGGLWDVGPHGLSSLVTVLGPVAGVVAVAGAGDLRHLVLRHESGATSTVTVTVFAPAAAEHHEVAVWGDAGVRRMPARPDGLQVSGVATAAAELVAAARSGQAHPVDLAFGTHIVDVLAQAQAQLGRGDAVRG